MFNKKHTERHSTIHPKALLISEYACLGASQAVGLRVLLSIIAKVGTERDTHADFRDLLTHWIFIFFFTYLWWLLCRLRIFINLKVKDILHHRSNSYGILNTSVFCRTG